MINTFIYKNYNTYIALIYLYYIYKLKILNYYITARITIESSAFIY